MHFTHETTTLALSYYKVVNTMMRVTVQRLKKLARKSFYTHNIGNFKGDETI